MNKNNYFANKHIMNVSQFSEHCWNCETIHLHKLHLFRRYTLDLFMYLNSSVNFFIYLVLRKNFRKSMKKLFTCDRRKQKQQQLEEVTSSNTEVTALKNKYFVDVSL